MKKRALTLLEIMIVIFLITLITGAIGYNMRGSLLKGKEFKTQIAQERLHEFLLLCLETQGKTAKEIADKPKEALVELKMVKDPAKLLVDGWNKPFKIDASGDDDFTITQT